MNERDLLSLLQCSTGWSKLLGNRELSRRVLRAQNHRISEIFPGVLSTDPKQLALTEFLVDELAKPHFKPAVSTAGLSENFMSGGESQLLSISVHKKLPMGVGIDDNLPNRLKIGEEKGGMEQPTARWLEIADAVSELLFSTWVDAPARFRKAASTSLPFFETGEEPKMRDLAVFVNYYMSAAPIEPDLMMRAGVYFPFVVVNRFQPDSAGKKRESWTGISWVSVDPTTPYVGHHGMRVRTAYAAPGSSSYGITATWTGYRAYYLNHYAFTYKHRTPEYQCTKINRFTHVKGVDVTQYDQSYPEEALQAFVNGARFTGYGPRYQEVLTLGLGAPSISACPFELHKEAPWAAVGDPLDRSTYRMNHGLPSGHPLNPDIGKYGMTTELLYRYDKYLIAHGRTLGVTREELRHNIDRILLGYNNEFAFLNSADDNLILSNNEEVLDAVIDAVGAFALDKEAVPVFLGVIYGGTPGNVVGHPNLMSYLVKWMVPEEGLGFVPGDGRAYFQTAWSERSRFYSSHPHYEEFAKLLEVGCERFHNKGVATLMMGRDQPILPTAFMTYEDQQFMMNPDIVHYRLDADMVSKELMDRHASYVDAEFCGALHKMFLQHSSV